MLASLQLGYSCNLNVGITHYGTGLAPVFFGDGYVSRGTWWKLRFFMSIANLVFWFRLGTLWWKIVGLW